MGFEQRLEEYPGFQKLAEEIQNKTTLKEGSFTDIIGDKEAPKTYGEAIQTDIEINGRLCDIYFSAPVSRVYIHYKD